MRTRKKNRAEERITRDPGVMLGKPCIRGTRLTVELVLERLAHQPVEDLLTSYPELTREDIQAALLYAAKEVGSRMVMESAGARP